MSSTSKGTAPRLPLEAALENSKVQESPEPLHVVLGHIRADIVTARQGGDALGLRLEP
jgi:hypothetical protein